MISLFHRLLCLKTLTDQSTSRLFVCGGALARCFGVSSFVSSCVFEDFVSRIITFLTLKSGVIQDHNWNSQRRPHVILKFINGPEMNVICEAFHSLKDLADSFQEWFFPFVHRVSILLDFVLQSRQSSFALCALDLLQTLFTFHSSSDSYQQKLWNHFEPCLFELLGQWPAPFFEMQTHIITTYATGLALLKQQSRKIVSVTKLHQVKSLVMALTKCFLSGSALYVASNKSMLKSVRDEYLKDYRLALQACSKLLQMEFVCFGPQLLDKSLHERLCKMISTPANSLVIPAVRKEAKEVLECAEEVLRWNQFKEPPETNQEDHESQSGSNDDSVEEESDSDGGTA